MANIYAYKILVKGKKNNCYALLGAMPKADDYEIIKEVENPDEDAEYALYFSCSCKWTVDAYTKDDNKTPVITDDELPLDPYEAENFGDKFYGVSLRSKSRILDVEIFCNSVDIDEPIEVYSEHYISGTSDYVDYEDMPEELKLDGYEEYAD